MFPLGSCRLAVDIMNNSVGCSINPSNDQLIFPGKDALISSEECGILSFKGHNGKRQTFKRPPERQYVMRFVTFAGVILTGLMLLITGCASVPYDGPNPCVQYQETLCTACARDNQWEIDPYPEAARDICLDYMGIYDYHRNSRVRCVADCLCAEEGRIQQKYMSCSKRNAARLRGHVKCYLKCIFIPTKGNPEAASEVGWEMLWPDFWRNPLSLW